MKNTKASKSIITAAGLLLLAGALLTYITLDAEEEPHEHAAAALATAQTSGQPQSGGLAAYDKNGDGIVYQGGMHPDIVQDEPGTCPICGMNRTPVPVDGTSGDGAVEIDPVMLQNIGVRTAEVAVEPLGRTIRTTGHFKMVEEGAETVSLKVGGWVEELYVDFDGAIVRKGQPLLELYSPKLVATQQEFLLAWQNARQLREGPAAEDAKRLLEAAVRRLAYWDLTEEQVRRLKETGEVQRTVTFYAPASGEVMHKKVVEGQHIEPGVPLMNIMDISSVWLIVDVHEQDLPWVEVGTPARIELASDPGRVYTGKVDYIYHMLDTQTRTAKARVTLPAGHHTSLKPGAYATVYLQSSMREAAPVVPAEAVLHTGKRAVVIEALGDGRFRPQEVTTGLQADGQVQVLEGLQGGEHIVTSAQFLIGSEAQLSSVLGAMVDEDAPVEMPMPDMKTGGRHKPSM